MSNIFASIARKATTLSPLMEGREKISVDDVIAKYPEGVTITGFDVISTGGDSFPVLVIKEDDNSFVFGGAIMNNIVHGWLEHFEGDIETANKSLVAAGGVTVKFTKSRTKSGNALTDVEVISK